MAPRLSSAVVCRRAALCGLALACAPRHHAPAYASASTIVSGAGTRPVPALYRGLPLNGPRTRFRPLTHPYPPCQAYLAVNGSDTLNDGLTLETPKATLSACVSVAGNGGTCYVRAGRYHVGATTVVDEMVRPQVVGHTRPDPSSSAAPQPFRLPPRRGSTDLQSRSGLSTRVLQ